MQSSHQKMFSWYVKLIYHIPKSDIGYSWTKNIDVRDSGVKTIIQEWENRNNKCILFFILLVKKKLCQQFLTVRLGGGEGRRKENYCGIGVNYQNCRQKLHCVYKVTEGCLVYPTGICCLWHRKQVFQLWYFWVYHLREQGLPLP